MELLPLLLESVLACSLLWLSECGASFSVLAPCLGLKTVAALVFIHSLGVLSLLVKIFRLTRSKEKLSKPLAKAPYIWGRTLGSPKLELSQPTLHGGEGCAPMELCLYFKNRAQVNSCLGWLFCKSRQIKQCLICINSSVFIHPMEKLRHRMFK